MISFILSLFFKLNINLISQRIIYYQEGDSLQIHVNSQPYLLILNLQNSQMVLTLFNQFSKKFCHV